MDLRALRSAATHELNRKLTQQLEQGKSCKKWTRKRELTEEMTLVDSRVEGVLTLPAHGVAPFRVPTLSQKLSLVLEVTESLAVKILCGALVHDGVDPWSIAAKDIPTWNVKFQVASGLPWHIAITGWTHHFEGQAIVGSITIRTSLNDDGAHLLQQMTEEQHPTPSPYSPNPNPDPKVCCSSIILMCTSGPSPSW